MNEQLNNLIAQKLSEIPANKGKAVKIEKVQIHYTGIYFTYSLDNSIQWYRKLYSWSNLASLTGY